MRHLFTGVVLALLFTMVPSTLCQAEVGLTTHEQAAKDFKFENIALGMELNAFRSRFPKTVKLAKFSDEKMGKEAFVLTKEDREVKAVKTAVCTFFEGKLYEIRAIYYEEDLARLGGSVTDGVGVLYKRLNEKLGGPTRRFESGGVGGSDKIYCIAWKFNKTSRHIQIDLDEESDVVRLYVVDTDAMERIKVKATAAADTGF